MAMTRQRQQVTAIRGTPGPHPARAARVGCARGHKGALVRAVGLLAAALLACAGPCGPLRANSDLEYRIKAAFLYNFARFVEWPKTVSRDRAEPIVLGLLGRDPFGSLLETTIKGKSVNGRPLVVRRFANLEELKPCHLIFISSSEKRSVPEVLQLLQGQSVLTVSEVEGFLRQGGVINFIIENDTVRFDINLEAAGRAQLSVSSQLLKVARSVHGSQ